MNRSLVLSCIVLILTACAGTPKLADAPQSNGEMAGYYAVSNLQQFESVYIRSTEIFAGYDKLLFAPLSMKGLVIDDSRLDHSETWTLRQGDEENAQQHFVQELAQVYRRPRNFQLVEDAGAKTLKVAVALVKYTPNAPRDTSRDRATGTQYFAEGIGRLYMRANITDAQSGELLAVIEDDRDLGSTWQENNRSNNLRRFKMGLNTWIVRIDNGLATLNEL